MHFDWPNRRHPSSVPGKTRRAGSAGTGTAASLLLAAGAWRALAGSPWQVRPGRSALATGAAHFSLTFLRGSHICSHNPPARTFTSSRLHRRRNENFPKRDSPWHCAHGSAAAAAPHPPLTEFFSFCRCRRQSRLQAAGPDSAVASAGSLCIHFPRLASGSACVAGPLIGQAGETQPNPELRHDSGQRTRGPAAGGPTRKAGGTLARLGATLRWCAVQRPTIAWGRGPGVEGRGEGEGRQQPWRSWHPWPAGGAGKASESHSRVFLFLSFLHCCGWRHLVINTRRVPNVSGPAPGMTPLSPSLHPHVISASLASLHLFVSAILRDCVH